MKHDLEYYIVWFFAIVVVGCVVYAAYTLHYMTQDKAIRVPCYEDETPRQCQRRLGSQFEVIYSAQSDEAWGEISL